MTANDLLPDELPLARGHALVDEGVDDGHGVGVGRRLMGWQFNRIFRPEKGPNVGPKTGPECHLKRRYMHKLPILDISSCFLVRFITVVPFLIQ